MERKFKFMDVVKWATPMNEAERKDVMVVEDTDDMDTLQVRHLDDQGNSTKGHAKESELRIVGKASPYEPIQDIVKRYIGK